MTPDEKITPAFSIGNLVETIEEYEDVDCPHEHGTITNIIEDSPDLLYEIDNKILIYEKWLLRVG